MPLALTILFFDLSILWLGYLAYLLPLSEIQPEASLSVTMRNAAGLMFTIAGSSLIMIVIASLLFVASSLVIILHLLLFATLMTFWGTRLTDAAIATVKERQEHATQTTENNDNRAPSGQIRPKEWFIWKPSPSTMDDAWWWFFFSFLHLFLFKKLIFFIIFNNNLLLFIFIENGYILFACIFFWIRVNKIDCNGIEIQRVFFDWQVNSNYLS